MNFLFFNKKQTKKFKETAFGFVSWGAGCREVYYNLYEDNKGLRQSKLWCLFDPLDGQMEDLQ